MTFEYLVNDSLNYCWIMLFIVACCCVLFNRLAGRTEDKCPTWKDKLQMGFIYFMCIFSNMFFIWLLMMAHEVWLALYWGVKL